MCISQVTVYAYMTGCLHMYVLLDVAYILLQLTELVHHLNALSIFSSVKTLGTILRRLAKQLEYSIYIFYYLYQLSVAYNIIV